MQFASSDAPQDKETKRAKGEVISPPTVISSAHEAAHVTKPNATPSMEPTTLTAERLSEMVLMTTEAERGRFVWLAADRVHTYGYKGMKLKLKLRFSRLIVEDADGNLLSSTSTCYSPKELAEVVLSKHEVYEVGRSYIIDDDEQGFRCTLQLLHDESL